MSDYCSRCYYEQLQRHGERACPFHQETKGSFRANLVKNAFHYFGCEAKGNILDFVSLKEGVSIREAALLIQDWFKISLESSQTAPGEEKRTKEISLSLPFTRQ